MRDWLLLQMRCAEGHPPTHPHDMNMPTRSTCLPTHPPTCLPTSHLLLRRGVAYPSAYPSAYPPTHPPTSHLPPPTYHLPPRRGVAYDDQKTLLVAEVRHMTGAARRGVLQVGNPSPTLTTNPSPSLNPSPNPSPNPAAGGQGQRRIRRGLLRLQPKDLPARQRTRHHPAPRHHAWLAPAPAPAPAVAPALALALALALAPALALDLALALALMASPNGWPSPSP